MLQHNVFVNNQGYSDINPISFGHHNCDPSYGFGPAVRDHYLIHFVVSGCGTFKAYGREYSVMPGEMFVIKPFVETYYQADEKNPWSYMWIGFKTERELPAELNPIIKCPEAFRIFDAMKRCEEFSTGRSAYLASKLWELFSVLLENNKNKPDYVEIALNCIHSEYMNGITISEIAERLELDRTYFYSVFKNKTGISPKKYLLQYRMKIAASLIKEMHKSVSVAAYSVGYNDIFTFSKMFKQCFGVSPSEYGKTN